jgi:hypothetical protein
MAKKYQEPTVLSVLQDLLIVQMASSGVPQAHIRTVVGVDIHRVNRIAKHAKKPKKRDD